MSLLFFLKALCCLYRYTLHAAEKVQESHIIAPRLVQQSSLLAELSHGPQFRHFAVSPEKPPVDKNGVTFGNDGISSFF